MITPCAKKGEPYKLTGCDPIMCLAPSAADKIDYQVGTVGEKWRKNGKMMGTVFIVLQLDFIRNMIHKGN